MKILITGGASGLGQAITKRFAGESGNKVMFTYCKSAENAKAIEKTFLNSQGYYLDFTNELALDEFCSSVSEAAPDVLVNNAITSYAHCHFHKTSDILYQQGFLQNVRPTMLITKAFLQLARKRRSGKIITILTSALVNRPPLGSSLYVAEKAYIASMAKSWAVENSSFGITSNCISPSFMDTHLNAGIDRRVVESIIENNPARQLLATEEVADTIMYLTAASSHINGVNLLINSAENII